ncbi:MAG: hypothetical protein ACTS6A_01705 [Candidatus Hodgkinia cicadicola]
MLLLNETSLNLRIKIYFHYTLRSILINYSVELSEMIIMDLGNANSCVLINWGKDCWSNRKSRNKLNDTVCSGINDISGILVRLSAKRQTITNFDNILRS